MAARLPQRRVSDHYATRRRFLGLGLAAGAASLIPRFVTRNRLGHARGSIRDIIAQEPSTQGDLALSPTRSNDQGLTAPLANIDQRLVSPMSDEVTTIYHQLNQYTIDAAVAETLLDSGVCAFLKEKDKNVIRDVFIQNPDRHQASLIRNAGRSNTVVGALRDRSSNVRSVANCIRKVAAIAAASRHETAHRAGRQRPATSPHR